MGSRNSYVPSVGLVQSAFLRLTSPGLNSISIHTKVDLQVAQCALGYVLYRALVTPHACARGKVIGHVVVVVVVIVVVIVSTKIAISRNVGI